MAVIDVQDLTKVYKTFWRRRKVVALDHLTLSVNEKSVFGFLGPNGAGKTTTIKLLLGLIRPTEGSGTLLEAPLGDEKVKKRLGFLPDSPGFYPHLSATAFLRYCAKLLHMEYREYEPKIDKLIDQMGLTEARNRKLGEFSRGMLQRIGIAQTLLNDPELVILDEPITGLDPLGRAEVKRIIRTLKEEGRTVFFSSHILADVEEMCDEVGILNHGSLICRGKIDDLLKQEEVTLWVDQLPASAVDTLEQFADSVTKKKGQWGFTLASENEKDAFEKKLQEYELKVSSVEGNRGGLEEFFLAKIEENNEKRNDAK